MATAANTIPFFEAKARYSHEVLPDGVYSCDEPSVRARFVDAFPASKTRPTICGGFFELRHEAAGRGITGVQWVDGSFVESKLDPEDVDVVTFCDYDFLNKLDTPKQQFVVESLNGRERTKGRYNTHTFLVPCCSAGHPYHPIFENWRTYWRKWFGKTRDFPNPPGPDLPGHPKGFIEMRLGDSANVPTVSTARSGP